MTTTHLILRNLTYHWRGNLAVLMGVFVGSAVLTGALLVGDSLQGSLRRHTERQLGPVDSALITGRFFRAELAEGLPGDARPVILMRGTARAAGSDAVSRIAIYGGMEVGSGGAALSAALAESLGVSAGDSIRVNVARASAIPRSSLLGRRGAADTTSSFSVPVAEVLPPDDPANDFSLTPSPGRPLNLFLPLETLQRQVEQDGRANAIFAGAAAPTELAAIVRERITLDDWGLRLTVPEGGPGYFALESKQLLIEPAVAKAAVEAARSLELRAAPTLVYLANRIVKGEPPLPDAYDNRRDQIPYSIVAALDPSLASPLGPFLTEGQSLADDEILLADWDESPLKGLDPGSPITLEFFEPEIEGRIVTTTKTFRLKGYVPLEGVASDPEITPEFPGITDKLSLSDWDPPFPYDDRLVLKRDEDFWDARKTTPKAYISLATGRELFGSRFGDLTSIRLAPAEGESPEETAGRFDAALRERLPMRDGGFVFDPVRERLLESSRGSSPFGLLFLGFSFFLIAAALLLVGLLVRLNLERRASQIGLMEATGFSRGRVRRMLLAEGATLAALGALLGLGGAALYAGWMIRLLEALWPSGDVAGLLELHVGPMSLIVGWGTTVLMSVGAIFYAVWGLSRIAPSALLAGRTAAGDFAATRRGPMYSAALVGVGFVGAVVLSLLARSIDDAEARAGAFFGSGACLLTASLAGIWYWMKKPSREPIRGHGTTAVASLGVRNAARHATRSLLTAGLLAAAAFLLVAVESFRRQPEADFLAKTGGGGGFPLVAESDLPVFEDLNPDADGEISLDLEDGLTRSYQDRGVPATEIGRRVDDAIEVLDGVRIYPFRLRGGDDASCLNLYQATRPRLLGVPPSLVERGGFRFAGTIADADNPWTLLDADPSDEAVPVFVEKNTAIWMLKLGMGDTLEMTDGHGEPMRLKIVGLLQDSVFQSELLMSEARFEKHFPNLEGWSYFLIECDPGRADEVAEVLETALAAQGFDAVPTRDKVAGYLEVQNTYLSTFQVLGGFGLLLGVLGLSVVLVRGVWERRGELALLRALGYRTRSLNWLVLAENAALLLLGLGAGVISALIAVAPHLLDNPTVPWVRLSVMLLSVVATGLIVASIAVLFSVRTPLLSALRKE